jgi:hypothetical protein
MNLDDPLDQSRPSWVLYNRLLALGVSVDEASSLMNGYAHELAERQRAAIQEFDLDDHWAVFYRVSDVESLPDLIDPEAQP